MRVCASVTLFFSAAETLFLSSIVGRFDIFAWSCNLNAISHLENGRKRWMMMMPPLGRISQQICLMRSINTNVCSSTRTRKTSIRKQRMRRSSWTVDTLDREIHTLVRSSSKTNADAGFPAAIVHSFGSGTTHRTRIDAGWESRVIQIVRRDVSREQRNARPCLRSRSSTVVYSRWMHQPAWRFHATTGSCFGQVCYSQADATHCLPNRSFVLERRA